MARKLPDPAERSEKEPAVLCISERVVALYNKALGKKATNVSKVVRDWFLDAARQEGWDAAIFIKDVENGKFAGCVLYKRPVNVIVNLFIEGEDDS